MTDVACGRHDVSVELITVPPEGVNITGADFTVGISFVTVTPMNETVSITFAAGISSVESLGLDLSVTASLNAGAATGA